MSHVRVCFTSVVVLAGDAVQKNILKLIPVLVADNNVALEISLTLSIF